eukprot:1386225-Amorphochlora_amoeboformis.AAC.1
MGWGGIVIWVARLPRRPTSKQGHYWHVLTRVGRTFVLSSTLRSNDIPRQHITAYPSVKSSSLPPSPPQLHLRASERKAEQCLTSERANRGSDCRCSR